MSEESSPPTAAGRVPEEEVRAAFSGPAVQSNKILLTMTASGARLAFLELHGSKVPPALRAAVLLSYQDALELRDLITRQLVDIEKDLRAFVDANPPAGDGNG